METMELKEFYDLMDQTIMPREELTRLVIDDKGSSTSDRAREYINLLKKALARLSSITEKNGKKLFRYAFAGETKTIPFDISYEITELKKDLIFLENTDDKGFFDYMSSIHDNFMEEVAVAAEYIQKSKPRVFVSDRDGTVNNYCGRYTTSVQSIYNAVFLSTFCSTMEESVILTSAPLLNTGIADISVMLEGSCTYAGSKGREYLDAQGNIRTVPIGTREQDALDELNSELETLLSRDAFHLFSLIGSGFQKKFGQTAISKQDIYGTIPKKDSDDFTKSVREVVQKVDRGRGLFHIEDTGYDIEIILSFNNKDFDKADGVMFLDKSLGMQIDDRPALLCGDTSSDLPMLKTISEKSPDPSGIFVTDNEGLILQVKNILTDALIVSSPDILVTALYKSVKGETS